MMAASQPSTPQLHLANSGIHSTVPLNDEEPFTLESWLSLLHAHIDNNKQLLLARVTTLDGLKYHYQAHALNKIMFRRVGEQYLFRVSTLNPLTNTEIAGNVEYFQVNTASIDVARSLVNLRASAPNNSRTRLSTTDIGGSALLVQALTTQKDNLQIAAAACSTLMPQSDVMDAAKIADKLDPSHNRPLPIGKAPNHPQRSSQSLGQKDPLDTLAATLRAVSHMSMISLNQATTMKIPTELSKKTSKSTHITETIRETVQDSSGGELLNDLPDDYGAISAEYIGDDDLFMTSTIMRSIFVKNALDPLDSDLFIMPEEVLRAEGVQLSYLNLNSESNDHDEAIKELRRGYQYGLGLEDPEQEASILETLLQRVADSDPEVQSAIQLVRHRIAEREQEAMQREIRINGRRRSSLIERGKKWLQNILHQR